MSLAISSSYTSAATSLVTGSGDSSSSDDIAALQQKLAAAEAALDEANQTEDADEAATQQALVDQYTAEIAAAEKAEATSPASASASGSAAAVQTSDANAATGGSASVTVRADLTLLRSPAGDGSADVPGMGEADDPRSSGPEGEQRSNAILEAYRENGSSAAG